MIDYDLELRHHNEALRRAYEVRASDQVLDVGCGTGQTTRDAALRAPEGAAFGIDRSDEMIARAQALTLAAGLPNVRYECADAERYAFPRDVFDLAISRFGTMFFGHPAAAFANIRSALRPDGRLVMMVWQPAARNEWVTSIERALAPGEALITRFPDTLRAFSLGDPDVVRGILDAAGFAAPAFDEVDVPVYYGAAVDAAFEFVSQFQFVQETAAALDGRERGAALDRLRDLLAEHQTTDGVWLDSRAWIVSARRS